MPAGEVTKADYSAIAEYYDRVRPGPADIWISSITSRGKIVRDSDVLDIGCGTGRFTKKTAEACGARIYALDSSAEMLRNALERDKERRVHWVLGDAHSVPFKSESFDCVFMTMVIHHIKSRETLLAEIRRLLRRGGRCVIVTTSHSAIRAHILRHFPGVTAIDLKRFPSIPVLKAAMKKANFKNICSSATKHTEREISVETYLEMVRNKYISTLSLLSHYKFERGFGVFEKKIRNLYGNRIRRVLTFNFVCADKP